MKRYLYLNFLAGIAIFVFLSACAQEGSGTNETFQMQESPLLRFFERKSGQIMYLGSDGNLFITTQVGGEPESFTSDAVPNSNSPEFRVHGRFAWSPNNEKIAFVAYTLEGPVLYTANKDGGERVEIFTSVDEYPIFLYWTPDGSQVSYLTKRITPDEYSFTDMKFYSVQADGLGTPQLIREWKQPIGANSQYFWTWDPIDSNRLFAHITGTDNDQLVMVSPESGRETAWTLVPGIFQTPAWSPDGFNLIVAITEDFGSIASRSSLVITDLRGRIENRITEVEGAVSFGWSPDGKRIAYISSDRTRGGAQGPLTVTSISDPEDTIVVENPYVFAYFWSPDSEKLAYFAQEITEGDESSSETTGYSLLVSLNVLDIKSGDQKNLLNFFPTDLFWEVLQYFDQYQNAVDIWSPDSENIVISAETMENEGLILVVPASGNIQPRPIASGYLALWSPQE